MASNFYATALVSDYNALSTENKAALFEGVVQKFIDNCHKSIDGLKLMVKWNQETSPLDTINLEHTDYTYSEMITELKTENWSETAWKQASEIILRGEPSGTVEVYYLDERPARDEGPFLKEEQNLIDAIAERLGSVVERRRAEEALIKVLDESDQRSAEVLALLESSRAVLKYREFEDAARIILDTCKEFIGATAGYTSRYRSYSSE